MGKERFEIRDVDGDLLFVAEAAKTAPNYVARGGVAHVVIDARDGTGGAVVLDRDSLALLHVKIGKILAKVDGE